MLQDTETYGLPADVIALATRSTTPVIAGKPTKDERAAMKAEREAREKLRKAKLAATKGKITDMGAGPESEPTPPVKGTPKKAAKIKDKGKAKAKAKAKGATKTAKQLLPGAVPVEIGGADETTTANAHKLTAAEKRAAAVVDAVSHVPAPEVVLSTNIAPSVEIATELQTAFDFFNHVLFDGKLEPVVFSNCRLKKTRGYFWPKQWARRAELKGLVHEIGLDFARLHGASDKEVLSTLVHEMCHLLVEQIGKAPTKPYHCKYWVAAMNMVGLTPVILDTKGVPTGKQTGPNSSHEIVSGGPFDAACDALISKGFSFSWKSEAVIEPEKKPAKKKKAGAKAKHSCPECGGSMWGKPTAVIMCTGTTDDKHDPVEMECDRGEYEGDTDGDEND